jgi:lipoprotein-anchoring transpeptidase ErfK/SrfK
MLRFSCVLIVALSVATEASAQSYSAMQPSPYARPPVMVVAPSQPQPRNLGGGFIQFLFGEGQGSQVVALPGSANGRPVYGTVDPQADVAPPQRVASLPHVPPDERYTRQEVTYETTEKPGTIVIDTPNKFLYLVEGEGRAMRYGIGVGRPGFMWSGVHNVSAKKEWPDWVPPREMLERQPYLPHFMPGGPENPLGARALYLGSTLYRIHGTNEDWTIGHNVSSGCIRLRNADVIDLYNRVAVGTKVVVL